jgi:spore maturation protein SpmA
MTLFIGLMQVLHTGGLLRAVAHALRRPLAWLFPDVPPDHPAMGMMILNMTSNMLGLANAATPFGLKAMIELEKLNQRKGTATDSMALFLAINTSNVALIPSGVIGLRASLGSSAPGSIFLTTLLATSISTLVAIIAAKALQRLRLFSLPPATGEAAAVPAAAAPDTAAAEAKVAAAGSRATPVGRTVGWVLLVALLLAVGFAFWYQATGVHGGGSIGVWRALKDAFSQWPLVAIIGAIVLYGVFRGVPVYDVTVDAGREGFQVGVRIMPYLVAILAGIGMLRASGGLDLLVQALAPLTDLIGMPAETVPMALIRPLSGNGAFGVAAEIMKVHGPDSLIGQIVSTMQGSCETTFYVLALYFGVIGIRVTRHTLGACLVADAAGLVAAVWACRWILG